MKSARSKVLHELAGKPIIDYCVETVRKAGITSQVIVGGRNAEELRSRFGRAAAFELNGTGKSIPKASQTVVLTTDCCVITLHFRRAKDGQGDTQIHIQRDLEKRDAEVERRVTAKVEKLERQHQDRLAKLDAQAEELAQQRILHSALAGPLEWVRPDVRPSRENHIVQRIDRVLRFGQDAKIVLLGIDNRDSPVFLVDRIEARRPQGQND